MEKRIKSRDSDMSWARSKSRESAKQMLAARTSSRDSTSTSKSFRGKPVSARIRSGGIERQMSPARAWVRPKTACPHPFPEGHEGLPGVLSYAECWSEPDSPAISLERPKSFGVADEDRIIKALSEQQSKHESRIAKMLEEHLQCIAEYVEGRKPGEPAALKGESLEDRENLAMIPSFTLDNIDNKGSSERPRSPAVCFSDETKSDPEKHEELDNKPNHQDSKRLSEKTLRRLHTMDWKESTTGFDGQIKAMDGMMFQAGKMKKNAGKNEKEKGLLKKTVASNLFETVSCFFIVSNAVMIGVELDMEISTVGQVPFAFRIINIFFLCIFSLELVLRILADGRRFYHPGHDVFWWNLFDTVLVLFALLEEVLANIDLSLDMSAMRLFRTLRLVRSFRIIRVVSIFRDLRVMLTGIAHSMRSLMWALLLLLCIMYLVSVVLVQYASQEILARAKFPEEAVLGEEEHQRLVDFYGSLILTIYTLWCSISGGLDWRDGAAPMFALGIPLGIVFCAYIAFSVLCVLNIVTGVFVENANKLCAQDEDMVMMEQMEMRKKWFEQIKQLFTSADADHSGLITKEQFLEKMIDVTMMTRLRKMGLQVETFTAEGLFALLDVDGDGTVDLDEFTMMLQSVSGNAKAIELAKTKRDARKIRKLVERILDKLE